MFGLSYTYYCFSLLVSIIRHMRSKENSLMITNLILLSHDVFLTYGITKHIFRLSHDIYHLSLDIFLIVRWYHSHLSHDIFLTCHMTSFSHVTWHLSHLSHDIFLTCHMTFSSHVTWHLSHMSYDVFSHYIIVHFIVDWTRLSIFSALS